MKKILSILFVLISAVGHAQSPEVIYGDYSYPGSVFFQKGLYIPVRDTTGFAPYRVGALVILPQDTVGHPAAPPVRMWNGNYWGTIGGGAGSIYFGNNGIHLAGNTFQLGDSLNKNTDIKTKGFGFSLNGSIKGAPLFRLSAGSQQLGFTELDSTLSGYSYTPAGKQGIFRFYTGGVPVAILQQGSLELNDSSLNNYLSTGKNFFTLTGTTGSAYAQLSPSSATLSGNSGSPYAVFSPTSAQLPPLANTDTVRYLSTDATGKLILRVPAGIRAIDSVIYDAPSGTFSYRYIGGTYLPVPTGFVDSLATRVKTNIYTADGGLTGNRTLNGRGNNLYLDSLGNFRVLGSGSMILQHLDTKAGLGADGTGGIQLVGGNYAGTGSGGVFIDPGMPNSDIRLNTSRANGTGVVISGLENSALEDSVLTTGTDGKLKLVKPKALDSLRYDPATAAFYTRYTTGGELAVPTGLMDSLNTLKGRLSDSSRIITWGAVGNGVTDNTTQINNCIEWCANNGRQYAIVDSGNFFISGRIVYSKKRVMFSGTGRILSYVLDNYGESEVGRQNEFSGKVNNGVISYAKSAQKIKDNDTIVIVVFGDSISSGWDIDFTNPTMRAWLIDQTNGSNSWYDYFVRQLYAKYGEKKIIIKNRGIPGYGLHHYNVKLKDVTGGLANRFITSTNRDSTWLQVVKALNPDLLFICHGMNDGWDYPQYFDIVQDSIASWAKTPEQVIMSTPSPNYTLFNSVDYGGYLQRVSRMDIAANTRWAANQWGFYLMDVARLHEIKRYGTDYTSYGFARSVKWYLDPVTNSDTTGKNFNLNAGASSVKVRRGNSTRDFSLAYTFNYTGTYDYYDIFNNGYSTIRFNPNTVEIYPLYSPNGSVGHITRPYTFTAGIDYRVQVTYAYDNVKVYVNDSLVAFQNGMCNRVGEVTFSAVNISNALSFTNLDLFDAAYTSYTPVISSQEMWGQLDSINGNAVNHPSIVGLNNVYFPVVREFISDLASQVSNSHDGDYIKNGSSLQTAQYNITGRGMASTLRTTAGSSFGGSINHISLGNVTAPVFGFGLLDIAGITHFRLQTGWNGAAFARVPLDISGFDGTIYTTSPVVMPNNSRIYSAATDSNAIVKLEFTKNDTTKRWGYVGSSNTLTKDINLVSDSGNVVIIEKSGQTYKLQSDAIYSSVPVNAPAPDYSTGGFSFLGRNNSTGRFEKQTPTTLSGFGITDGVTTNTAQTISGTKTFSASEIFLNNSTSQLLRYTAQGQAAPTFTTRSAGTKIVLRDVLGASTVDYGIGVENANIWIATAQNAANFGIKIYGGTTPVAWINGLGQAAFGQQAAATSTLQSGGSFAAKDTATVGSITLGDQSIIRVTNSAHAITLPTASTCKSRVYEILNETASGVTITSVIDFATGSGSTTIPTKTYWRIYSDGTNWILLSRSN